MHFLRSRRHSDHFKWWVLSCTSLGMLLATVNSGTLIIALPQLERSLHTSLLQLVWVILVYMIVSTVLVLTAGRLSDLFGRKHAYVLGFLLFSAASLGAGFSGSGTQLILWRILQGIGGAFLFANAAALVTDAFPKKELGLAMGTNTMVAAVGLVIGPVLGGALVAISWHWVFWFNVPFGIAGSAWAYLVLHELAGRDRVRGLDLAGTSAFVIGLTGLVLALSKGGLSGWSGPLVVGGLVAAVVLLPVFVVIEHRGRAPMLDLALFRNKLFAAASAAAFINGLSRFALMFLFVFYFQGPQGQTPIIAGLELAPLAIGMLVSSPLAGIAADRYGSRGLAAMGMLVSAAGLARRHRFGHVQQPQHCRNDGRRSVASPRHRRGCACDVAEHRRRHFDCIRDGGRDVCRAKGRAVQDLLRHHVRALAVAARAVHLQHAHGALGARRDLIARRRSLDAAAGSYPRRRSR